MRDNIVKRRLASGGTAFGTMVFEFASTGVARIASAAGVDFMVYDMEHSAFSIETIRGILAAARCASAVPLVRVPVGEYTYIARVLDAGAMGIMVPMVQTAEQAAQIASAARYPPAGRRGAAFRVAHDDYSEGDVPDKMRTANEEVMVIAQIETEQGVENVDRIAGTAGVDVIWIGHYDLTCGMGIPGEFQHPRYRRAVDKVLEAGKRHRKAVGFMASSIDEACNLLSEGFRCIAYSLDIAIYQQALKEALGHIRAYERSEWR